MDVKKPVRRTRSDATDLGQSFAVKLMQHQVVPTFVLDAECKVLIWNKACERLTGVPATEHRKAQTALEQLATRGGRRRALSGRAQRPQPPCRRPGDGGRCPARSAMSGSRH